MVRIGQNNRGVASVCDDVFLWEIVVCFGVNVRNWMLLLTGSASLLSDPEIQKFKKKDYKEGME